MRLHTIFSVVLSWYIKKNENENDRILLAKLNLQFIQLCLVQYSTIWDWSLKEIASKAKLLQAIHAADLWKWIRSWKLIAAQISVRTFPI